MADTDDAIRFKAVNHITYNVTDLNRALRFWVDVLGVKQIPKQVDSDRLLWLQVPSGTMVHIILNDDAPSAPSHHSAFEVDDIDAECERLRDAGLRLLYDSPQPGAHGSQVMFIHPMDCGGVLVLRTAARVVGVQAVQEAVAQLDVDHLG